jgi:hypothetical protein
MFYVLIFSIVAVILVVAGLVNLSRRRRRFASAGLEDAHAGEDRAGSGHHGGQQHASHGKSDHREVNRRRKQARQARRQRH